MLTTAHRTRFRGRTICAHIVFTYCTHIQYFSGPTRKVWNGQIDKGVSSIYFERPYTVFYAPVASPLIPVARGVDGFLGDPGEGHEAGPEGVSRPVLRQYHRLPVGGGGGASRGL